MPHKIVLANNRIFSPFSVFFASLIFLGGFAVISANAETVITPDGTIETNIQDYSLYGPSATEKATLQKEVIYLTNQERLKHGLMPLKDDSTTTNRLHSASTWYAQWLTDNNWFSHDEPNGRDPGRRIRDFGYVPIIWGENIGAGYTTPARAVDGWMNSPDHRYNMLHSGFCELGVGLGYNDNYNFWYSGYHYQNVKRAWVQKFGCRSGFYPLIINAEAESTNSRNVNMHVYGQGWAAHMSFSNDGVNWSGWEDYRNTKNWTLTPGSGNKRVHVQLMNRYGQIISNSDEIHLDDPTPVNKKPLVNLTHPSATYTYTEPANIYIRANASDPDGSISKVEFYMDETLLYTDYYSIYSYTWSNLRAGTYTFKAKAYDNKGATSISESTITVREAPNKAPSVTLDSPANGYQHPYPKTIELRATANDPDGSISRVEFYRDNALIYTDYTAPYAINKHDVPSGETTFYAKAYDNKGATAISTKNTINLPKANVAPTVSLLGLSSQYSYPAPATVKMIAKADDSDGSISKVEFYYNNVLVYTDYSAPYEYTRSGLASGNHSFYARAYDDKGAVTASEVSIVKSNELAIPNLVNPINGQEFTLGETVTLDVDITDKEGDVPYAVLFYQNGKYIGYDMTAPFSKEWTPTEAGNYDIKIKLMNYGYGLYTYDNDTTIKVVEDNNQLPTGTLTLSHDVHESHRAVHFYLDANDPDGSISKVEFYANDRIVSRPSSSKIANGDYNGSWGPQGGGTFLIKARIYDDKGAFSDSNVATLTIIPRREAPIVDIISPTPNSPKDHPRVYGQTHYIKRGEGITLKSRAYDTDGEVRFVMYILKGWFSSKYLGISYNSANDYEVNISPSAVSYYLDYLNKSQGTIRAIAYDNEGLQSRQFSHSYIYLREDEPF